MLSVPNPEVEVSGPVHRVPRSPAEEAMGPRSELETRTVPSAAGSPVDSCRSELPSPAGAFGTEISRSSRATPSVKGTPVRLLESPLVVQVYPG